MIKVNELRVGNWVECTFIGKVQVTKEDIGDWPALGGSGIQLTPEILEKAGFKRSDNSWYLRDIFFLKIQEHGQWINDKPIVPVKYIAYKSGVGAIIEVKTVHQLQNLYFAITDEELQINL